MNCFHKLRSYMTVTQNFRDKVTLATQSRIFRGGTSTNTDGLRILNSSQGPFKRLPCIHCFSLNVIRKGNSFNDTQVDMGQQATQGTPKKHIPKYLATRVSRSARANEARRLPWRPLAHALPTVVGAHPVGQGPAAPKEGWLRWFQPKGVPLSRRGEPNNNLF